MSADQDGGAPSKRDGKEGRKIIPTAITMAPPAASEVLREVMACGADEGILLCDRAFAGGDTSATSGIGGGGEKAEVSPSYLPEDRPRTVKRATWGRSWQNIWNWAAHPGETVNWNGKRPCGGSRGMSSDRGV